MMNPETLTDNRHAISDEKWQLFPVYIIGRPPLKLIRDDDDPDMKLEKKIVHLASI